MPNSKRKKMFINFRGTFPKISKKLEKTLIYQRFKGLYKSKNRHKKNVDISTF